MSDLTWLRNGHHKTCARYVEYGYTADGALREWATSHPALRRDTPCTCDEMRLPL